ncbi:MAG: aminotransferase class V-fold PLP-dependent enzyme [Fimbriimonadaceae bacterium]|nr:aminotransferase class V-fold PLP-dependent enzyme [Fimbriimonadaceae bacterium]
MSYDLARYFDYAATTPLDANVRAEMEPYLGEAFGNPNSPHAWGQRARAAVELARERIAEVVGGAPHLITFFGSASEANRRVLEFTETGSYSPMEHDSVRRVAMARGFAEVPAESLLGFAPGHVPQFELPVGVCAIIHTNNETGMVVESVPAVTHYAGEWYDHRDASQSLGRVDLVPVTAHSMTLCAHKAYGPRGASALINYREPPHGWASDGGQELAMGLGTPNVAAIVGFGLAATLAEERREADFAHAAELRALFLDELRTVSDWQVNEAEPDVPPECVRQVPHILSVSFAGVEGETLVIEADARGYAISSGAACSTGSIEPSHVLLALGVPMDMIRGTVRISFGRYNDALSTVRLAQELRGIVAHLRDPK